ncbi:uncharacterized protein MYCFIDRAFT_180752 [Pseudocercospora fijiensis CIRAD86]|uniref:Uncharacterized protein n=1 Tax=Pseudocercospora fijiensis (strain CIRAD86) TaxID=383855 RepID=M2ZXG5_PSEFD|nr:uncharacterized protein MYCFIDRAFT_180752 [Pseudocercospora fijiensis CIRAD86]EME76766.1 hypothetical protein MYCFIDRAFT_180752 [Pseudocercospora fijiensis CIRAD86]
MERREIAVAQLGPALQPQNVDTQGMIFADCAFVTTTYSPCEMTRHESNWTWLWPCLDGLPAERSPATQAPHPALYYPSVGNVMAASMGEEYSYTFVSTHNLITTLPQPHYSFYNAANGSIPRPRAQADDTMAAFTQALVAYTYAKNWPIHDFITNLLKAHHNSSGLYYRRCKTPQILPAASQAIAHITPKTDQNIRASGGITDHKLTVSPPHFADDFQTPTWHATSPTFGASEAQSRAAAAGEVYGCAVMILRPGTEAFPLSSMFVLPGLSFRRRESSLLGFPNKQMMNFGIRHHWSRICRARTVAASCLSDFLCEKERRSRMANGIIVPWRRTAGLGRVRPTPCRVQIQRHEHQQRDEKLLRGNILLQHSIPGSKASSLICLPPAGHAGRGSYTLTTAKLADGVRWANLKPCPFSFHPKLERPLPIPSSSSSLVSIASLLDPQPTGLRPGLWAWYPIDVVWRDLGHDLRLSSCYFLIWKLRWDAMTGSSSIRLRFGSVFIGGRVTKSVPGSQRKLIVTRNDTCDGVSALENGYNISSIPDNTSGPKNGNLMRTNKKQPRLAITPNIPITRTTEEKETEEVASTNKIGAAEQKRRREEKETLAQKAQMGSKKLELSKVLLVGSIKLHQNGQLNTGRDVGAEQNEPDYIQSVTDTMRSPIDKAVEYVARNPGGSIVATEKGYVSELDPNTGCIGTSQSRNDITGTLHGCMDLGVGRDRGQLERSLDDPTILVDSHSSWRHRTMHGTIQAPKLDVGRGHHTNTVLYLTADASPYVNPWTDVCFKDLSHAQQLQGFFDYDSFSIGSATSQCVLGEENAYNVSGSSQIIDACKDPPKWTRLSLVVHPDEFHTITGGFDQPNSKRQASNRYRQRGTLVRKGYENFSRPSESAQRRMGSSRRCLSLSLSLGEAAAAHAGRHQQARVPFLNADEPFHFLSPCYDRGSDFFFNTDRQPAAAHWLHHQMPVAKVSFAAPMCQAYRLIIWDLLGPDSNAFAPTRISSEGMCPQIMNENLASRETMEKLPNISALPRTTLYAADYVLLAFNQTRSLWIASSDCGSLSTFLVDTASSIGIARRRLATEYMASPPPREQRERRPRGLSLDDLYINLVELVACASKISLEIPAGRFAITSSLPSTQSAALDLQHSIPNGHPLRSYPMRCSLAPPALFEFCELLSVPHRDTTTTHALILDSSGLFQLCEVFVDEFQLPMATRPREAEGAAREASLGGPRRVSGYFLLAQLRIRGSIGSGLYIGSETWTRLSLQLESVETLLPEKVPPRHFERAYYWVLPRFCLTFSL